MVSLIIDTPFGKNGLPVTFLIPYQEDDLLSLSPEKFKEKAVKLESNSIKVRDLLIKRESYLSVTLLANLYSERLPDGWENLPVNNWHFLIEYGNNKQLDSQFSFLIHSSSPKRAVKFEHYGFGNY